MSAGKWITDQLDKHGVTLALAGALFFSNINSDSARTGERLQQIEARLTEIAARQREAVEERRRDRQRASCVVRTADRLADRAGIAMPCSMEGE